MLCKLCNLPVPPNEANAYGGRHEDCALGQEKLPPSQNGSQSAGKTPAKARKTVIGFKKGERRD